LTNADAEEGEFSTNYKLHGDWTKIAPGWCVVTAKIRSNDDENSSDIALPSMVDQEDYKSVCCAIQNFMLSMWSEGIGTKWTTGPVQKTKEFADLCGADHDKVRVVGIIWYGYAAGGAKYADPRRRLLSVEDVLTTLP
jgi:nitroreductase